MSKLDFIIQILTLVFGGVGGYFIKSWLDSRSERERQRHKEKEPHYRNLLLCIKSLASGKKEHIDLFLYEYYFLWLYAPDDVIQAAHKLVLRISTDENIAAQLKKTELTNLLTSIRRDMGFKDTEVSEEELTFPKEFVQ